MNSFNPIGFVTRDEIPLTIDGRKVTGFALDLDELTALAKKFDWFDKRMRGLEVKREDIPESDLLEVAALMVAACVAPDTRGEERRVVEASARAIRATQRIDLLNSIMEESFEKLNAEGGASAGGNAKPLRNRQQRRAARSTGGGAKPQT